MDKRETTREDDIAYALAGIFCVHLMLACGEEEMARDRLLQEVATPKSDISFLSFRAAANGNGVIYQAVG